MLATIPEFREVDFSHLKLTDAELESSASVRKSQSPLLWFALLLSALLHLSLLLLEFSSNQPRPKQASTHALHIDLLQAPLKKNDAPADVVTGEIAPLQSAQEVVQDVVVSTIPATKMVTVEQPREAQRVARLLIEPLTAQELAEVVDRNNTQSNYQGSAAISENVFHPGLRGKLIAEANKPQLARVEDSALQTYTDPAGATVVKLADGSCLMSPHESKIGAPKNWYMTPCGGKSESEQIMKRVNQDANGKLRFDETD